MNPKKAFSKLKKISEDSHAIGDVSAIVSWDQEVNMPPKGLENRGRMMSWLAQQRHKNATNPEVGEALKATLSGDWNEKEKACLREWQRGWDLSTKIPADLVQRSALASVKGHESWKSAREKNDFSIFRDDLKELIDLSKERAECIGYTTESYDALLDMYQAGMNVQGIDALFTNLKNKLTPLLEEILDWQGEIEDDPVAGHYSQEEQKKFCEWGAKHIGFDFDAGRIDTAVHPFCSGAGPGDIRLTTRYNLENPFDSFFGSLHETGHGLYEQGLPSGKDEYGTPLSESVSLGIHESQSLFWESIVGQSPEFWEYVLPFFKEHFPGRADSVTHAQIVRRTNKVSRSLIRVEADEVTYPLHVILRFEIERDIFRGNLSVDDLPDAWNQKMQELIGVTPPNNTLGVLQDVHWSMGGFGYFPTYALGRLYSAQFTEKLSKDIPSWKDDMAKGDCSPALKWSRKNIHSRGSIYRTEQLIEKVTGTPPSEEPFLSYLRKKYKSIFS